MLLPPSMAPNSLTTKSRASADGNTRRPVSRVLLPSTVSNVQVAVNEALFMGLALFIFYMSWMSLHQLDMDDGPFGYDFSAGYTSLEKDEEPPPKLRLPSPPARR